jgi:hypothetical protein
MNIIIYIPYLGMGRRDKAYLVSTTIIAKYLRKNPFSVFFFQVSFPDF